MFMVDKNTLPRYWYAGVTYIEERIGEPLGNEGEFDTQDQAMKYAASQTNHRRLKEYNTLADRYSRLQIRIFALRALWNDKVRAGLARHRDKVAAAQQQLLASPHIEVRTLPDQIPVKGTRLEIGSTVYVIDSYSLTFQASEVQSETVYYYSFHPEGVAAYYALDHGSVKSTLESGFSNLEFYIDRDTAVARIHALWRARIAEIETQMKTLQ